MQQYIEIDRDRETGLALVKDANDPPRYYVQSRRRANCPATAP
jgi:hypothetical protein